jgi:hypothetical protein
MNVETSVGTEELVQLDVTRGMFFVNLILSPRARGNCSSNPPAETGKGLDVA